MIAKRTVIQCSASKPSGQQLLARAFLALDFEASLVEMRKVFKAAGWGKRSLDIKVGKKEIVFQLGPEKA